MHIKSIVTGAAIALAVSIGAASAAEMSMLKGISAEPMTAAEMTAVRGGFDSIPTPIKANFHALPPSNRGTARAVIVGTTNGALSTFGPLWFGKAAHFH